MGSNWKNAIIILILSYDTCVVGQTFPSGCSYSSDTGTPGIFTCDYATVTLPLTFNTFGSPYPQRLVISNVDGQLPASTPTASFSGFSSMNTANLDTNFPASLEISCLSGGSLILFAGTFSGLSYMQTLKIKNCIISSGLPNNVFSDFTELDSLIIEGGQINGLNADSLSGVNITNLAIPDSLGLFALMNLALDTNTFPSGFFYPISNAKKIVLDNLATSSAMSLPADTFTQNTVVQSLSLAHNSFTTLENNILTNLAILEYLNLTGIKYACSCDSLGVLDTISSVGVEVIGGIVCDSPSDYQDKRATTYFYNVCPQDDACQGTSDVELGGDCITPYMFGEAAANVVILIFSCAILVSVIKARQAIRSRSKQTIPRRGNRQGRPRKKRPTRKNEV